MVAEFWQWLIAVTGGSAVLVLVGRKLLDQLFSRDLERFKADLQRDAALELERAKSEFRKESVRDETSYRWLHAKRTEATEDLYQKFVMAAFAIDSAAGTAILLQAFGGEGSTLDDQMGEARQSWRSLSESVKAYRPVIPDEVEDVLSGAAKEMERQIFNLSIFHTRLLTEANDQRGPRPESSIEEIGEGQRRVSELEDRVVTVLRSSLGNAE